MLELELDYNQRIGEWSVMTESDSQLKPLYGPGFTGLINLGNSCYLNSVIQVMFSIPEFQAAFTPLTADKFMRQLLASNDWHPASDFSCQISKLADGLLSGRYSKPPVDGEIVKTSPGIRPIMFKNVVSAGHSEFSTKRQQDAQEFYLYLMNVIDRNHKINGKPSPTKCLAFEIEDRIECTSSGKVNYTSRTEYFLPLPIPMDKVTNRKEVSEFEARKESGETIDPKDVIRPKIPLDACFESFISPEEIDDFYSTAINGKTKALKRSRLKTFPDFLMLQVKKFALGDDWVPKKLDVAIQVPDIIDLKNLRSNGLQEGEELLPDLSFGSQIQSVVFDDEDQGIINSLADMGFPMDACKRAVHLNLKKGLETALNWIFEHSNDPDFADPFNPTGQSSSGASFVPDPEGLESLKAMGIPEAAAIRGLKETQNNIERAIDWIFNHPEAELEPESSTPSTSSSSRDGSEKYQLKAFISHMGSSTLCGHYVCHIKKDGQWVIFNDEKVALSSSPPQELAYLYLYERL